MKKQIKLLFHTPRFMIGFVILALILGVIFIYPIFDDGDPLRMISLSFRKPGTVAMDGRVIVLGSDNFGRDVLLNLDRFAGIIEDVIACVERHGMREQILLKTPPKPETLAAIERYAPDYMYMPICWEEDSCIATIERMHINLVGAELVFLSEQAPVIQPEALQRLRDKGLVLWGNALLYSDAVPLAAGHSDDVSLLDDPAKGWGWLAEKGFGIIQTDWTLHCCQYLREKGYSR